MNKLTKNYILQQFILKLNNKGYNIVFSGLYNNITINNIKYKCKEGLYLIKDYILKEGIK